MRMQLSEVLGLLQCSTLVGGSLFDSALFRASVVLARAHRGLFLGLLPSLSILNY